MKQISPSGGDIQVFDIRTLKASFLDQTQTICRFNFNFKQNSLKILGTGQDFVLPQVSVLLCSYKTPRENIHNIKCLVLFI